MITNTISKLISHMISKVISTRIPSEVGGESNWEIVSFRSCVLARGLVADWNWIAEGALSFSLLPWWGAELSLFHVGSEEFSLFPSPHPTNLLANCGWAYRWIISNRFPNQLRNKTTTRSNMISQWMPSEHDFTNENNSDFRNHFKHKLRN